MSMATLMALTGEAASPDGNPADIYGVNVTRPAGLMAISFVIGLISTSIAAWVAVGRLTDGAKSRSTPQ